MQLCEYSAVGHFFGGRCNELRRWNMQPTSGQGKQKGMHANAMNQAAGLRPTVRCRGQAFPILKVSEIEYCCPSLSSTRW